MTRRDFVRAPRFQLDPLQRRRWENFRANKRGYWCLIIFSTLFLLSLVAELWVNDKPLLISHEGQILSPVFTTYAETRFGGDFETEADYTDPVVQCLITTGGNEECIFAFEDVYQPFMDDARACLAEGGAVAACLGPYEDLTELRQTVTACLIRTAGDPGCTEDVAATEAQAPPAAGWMIWPLVPWSYDTITRNAETFPAPPSGENWLGTDDRGRDVLAITVYGFRLSVLFGLMVTVMSSIVGVLAGAAQGYFGGWVDLFFQRIVEIWANIPTLFVIIIVTSVFAPNFWLLMGLLTLFSWTALVGVVRAEFLRARNFEYVMAARALGVGDTKIMFRHLLPNAMVATLTMLPFVLTNTISSLAVLDYLGFGLSESYPSLGEIGLQGKNNLQAPWLGLTAFFTLAIMLSMLVFIFEAVRDAFDPRKTFAS